MKPRNSTSPRRFPIPTARRMSATPTSSWRPTLSPGSSGSTAVTSYFLTGTDEHGMKMQQTATREGHRTARARRPQSRRSSRPWPRRSGCSNDDFIRTTEARHYRASRGNLAAHGRRAATSTCRHYAGWYSVRDEAYYDESELTEAARRQCAARRRHAGRMGRGGKLFLPPLRLSGPASRPLRGHPGFRQPGERRNEIVSFVKGGLQDLSISRTTFDWGLPVPGDPKHVMYVWVDALTNYITGCGFPDENRAALALSGRRTCTSSARTSCASTPSIGRPF